MMNPPVDLTVLPVPAQRILDPNGPAPLRAMAAKGVMPGLKPGDIVTVLCVLCEWPDPAVSSVARTSLGALPRPMLEGALSADLQAGVIDALADAYAQVEDVIGRLLEMRLIAPETVARLAQQGTDAICERIATNEARLLANPIIIEALYMSRATRMSTADRVLELAVRNNITLNIPAFKEAAAAIQDELIPEPSPEPTPDDVAYAQVAQLAEQIVVDAAVEDTHVLDDEGNEKVIDKCKPLWVLLADMTVSQKIRRATLGSGAERMMLVRDTNRLVACAAIRSPLIQENEIVRICSSRSVNDDILRIIANSREWTKSYQVKLNLVMNPRCPFTFAAKLIPLLRENDLKAIAKSKNVAGSVATAARQHMSRRQGKGQ